MLKRWITRSFIIFLWLLLIFFSLYLPKIIYFRDDTLNVFAWGDILDPAIIADFEKKTNIKVNLSYYSSNEELLVKLKATKGEGYDLIIPSDYAVTFLRNEGLLKEIDHTKLNFYNRLSPSLLGHGYDPENKYSIPFEWEIYGLGIDKDYFKIHPLVNNWKMLFENRGYKVSMTNDPAEATLLTTFFLFNKIDPLTTDELTQVKDLLIKQKKWVEAYANFRGDYFLATKNCPVVFASSSYIWRTMRLFDFVDFIVPEEGSFITIENLCIPKASRKEELVYKLMNYLYQPEILIHHFDLFGFFPPTQDKLDEFSLDPKAERWIFASQKDFDKFHFYRPIVSQQQMRDMWVELKR